MIRWILSTTMTNKQITFKTYICVNVWAMRSSGFCTNFQLLFAAGTSQWYDDFSITISYIIKPNFYWIVAKWRLCISYNIISYVRIKQTHHPCTYEFYFVVRNCPFLSFALSLFGASFSVQCRFKQNSKSEDFKLLLWLWIMINIYKRLPLAIDCFWLNATLIL